MPAKEDSPSPVPGQTSPTQARWAGLAGTTLVAVGAVGAGVLPRPDPLAHTPLRLLRDGLGLELSIAMAALGMLLWVAAWWSLRRAGDYSTRWMTITAALWALPLALTPPLLSRDVYSYAAQGQSAAHGLNPYEHGPADLGSDWLTSTSPSWYHSHAPYGPLFVGVARLSAALGDATGHLEVAIFALRLITVAAVALLAAYLPRLAKACGVDPARAQWLGLASPLLLAHSVAGVHQDVIMIALLVAGLAYVAERQPILGGLFLGAAIAIKAPAIVVFPFSALLTWLPGSRPLRLAWLHPVQLVATCAASLIALTLVAGFGWGWVDALRVPGDSVQWTSVPTSWGMAAGWLVHPASAWTLPGSDDTALSVARAVGTGLLAITLIANWGNAARRVFTSRRAEAPAETVRLIVRGAGLALLALVLLAPAFHPWYFLWPLVLLSASLRQPQGITVLSIAAAALCFLVLPDGYNLARATLVPGALAVVAATLTLACVALIRLRRQRIRRRYQESA
ncbi:MAG: polyprenol phosphomannose-dependent alpha 1,6 mannosyltransferase MptB [Mycobacteriales bacterium]